MGLCLTYRVGSNVLILANFCTLARKKKGGALQIHTRDFYEKNSPKSSYLEVKII